MSTKKNFEDILNKGAEIDPIFQDAPTQRGADPYDSIAVVEVDSGAIQVPESEEATEVPISNEQEISSSATSRKLAIAEAMISLITKDCSFDEMLGEILMTAFTQIKSEAGSIIEMDYLRKVLFFRSCLGRNSEQLHDFTIPFGQGIAGFVCTHQQPLIVSQLDESRVHLKAISDAIGFEAKNLIAFPIVIRGVSFGCVELLNRLGEELYTEEDKEVLAFACEVGAKVIENRLILADLERAANGVDVALIEDEDLAA
ncbi:MAG: GAF domain-containing protein [Bacteriovoracia bacterium]